MYFRGEKQNTRKSYCNCPKMLQQRWRGVIVQSAGWTQCNSLQAIAISYIMFIWCININGVFGFIMINGIYYDTHIHP